VFPTPGLALVAGGDNFGARLASIAPHIPAVVGVTLGADGFLWLDGKTERRIAAPRIVAVDNLAAGDVWQGAFALALAEGGGISCAARFANAAAALKCTRLRGRTSAPPRAEVAAFLATTW
jgi:sulfofructose kinase